MEDVLRKAREELLMDLFNNEQYKPMKFKELCGLLNVPKDERNDLRTVLDSLMKERFL